MIVLNGAGVGSAIAIGSAVVVYEPGFQTASGPPQSAQDVNQEIQKLDIALQNTVKQLHLAMEKVSEDTPGEIATFFEAHVLMVEDRTLRESTVEIIRKNRCSAETALLQYRNHLIEVFENIEDPYLRSKQDDVNQVFKQIYRQMTIPGQSLRVPNKKELSGKILVAHDLTPSEMVYYKDSAISAFVTDLGSPISHVAILARSMGIPAVVGLHGAIRYIAHGDILAVDSHSSIVVVDPSENVLLDFQRRKRIDEQRRQRLLTIQKLEARTLDGHEIQLMANVELPTDIEMAVNSGATGVGLYRTEYLFMNRDEPPDEEEQVEAYRRAVQRLKTVTIRTLDLGADKQVDGGRQRSEQGNVVTNPALGVRAVRLCLRHQELFRPQLRAIFRASAYGSVQCMIPMLSSINEVYQVMAIIEEIKMELADENIPHDPNVPIGGMVEVPAVAIMAEMFAEKLDFLSIGTNDLIQYTLAIDRVDDEVNYLYDPLHPSVLQLIRNTIKAGAKVGKPVSLCGEMAGEVIYTKLLLGLGLRIFSLDPATLLEVKQIVRNSHLSELENQVQELTCEADSDYRRELLHRLNTASETPRPTAIGE